MYFLQLPALPADQKALADSVGQAYTQNVARDIDSMVGWLQQYLSFVPKWVLEVGLKLLLAIVVYIVGRWLIKRILKFMGKVMERRNVDLSLRSFLNSLVRITLIIILIFAIIGILGINTTSFIALFGAAGLAIGMALSGTLQNFAGGVMILVVRPFRIGDFIEAQGQSGTVQAIQLTYTILNTPDNKTIYLPNGPLSTGIINNSSREDRRRIEWVFGIDYGNDYDYAKKAILELIEKDSRIFKDPKPLIAINSLGDSSVNVVVRGWTLQKDFWDVYFNLNEQVFKVFAAKGINIPYPQMDVHLYQGDEGKEAKKETAGN